MKLAVYSSKPYDERFFSTVRSTSYPTLEITYHAFALTSETASVSANSEAICVFVNDVLNAEILKVLHEQGTKAILLRCAGYNNVDLQAAKELGLFVANVPSYSPEAVAEFAVALIQTLNRKTHRAYNRVREGNFALEGLLGFTLAGKTVGVVGTGKIGRVFAKIMHGFGCKVLGYDVFQNDEFKTLGDYVELLYLLNQSDIVSLHCPLLDSTRHIINSTTLSQMKDGAMLVNTSRGGLVDTSAVIQALKTKKLGALALDVYEAEAPLFYSDHSGEVIQDDVFARLVSFGNVLVCSHQGFFTEEALMEIAEVSLGNLEDWRVGRGCKNDLMSKGQ